MSLDDLCPTGSGEIFASFNKTWKNKVQKLQDFLQEKTRGNEIDNRS